MYLLASLFGHCMIDINSIMVFWTHISHKFSIRITVWILTDRLALPQSRNKSTCRHSGSMFLLDTAPRTVAIALSL